MAPSSYVRLCDGDIAYRRLSDWTRLQWALYSWRTQRASLFFAVKGGDEALPSYFVEDLLEILVRKYFA